MQQKIVVSALIGVLVGATLMFGLNQLGLTNLKSSADEITTPEDLANPQVLRESVKKSMREIIRFCRENPQSC